MKYFVWIVVLFCISCTPSTPQRPSPNTASPRALLLENKRLQDSFTHLLHSGDLVLRTGADVTSTMFVQINTREKKYSHCGIVIVENGYPFIYHSIGGEDNPDEKMRRDSANYWCSPNYNLGMAVGQWQLNDAQKQRLLDIIKEWYSHKLVFDMDFDLATDDKLYCAEMVYKAIALATKDSLYIQPTSFLNYHFVAIDNLYLNEHTKLVCQLKYK